MVAPRREVGLVAAFDDSWEAELAQGYLVEAGIPAWIEVARRDDPFRVEAAGRARLFAPADRVEEARRVLEATEATASAERPPARRYPIWVSAVGLVVVVGLVVAAVPRVLWAPVLLFALVGFLVWRLVRPVDRR